MAKPVSRSIDTTRAKAATLGHTVGPYGGDNPILKPLGIDDLTPTSNVASPHLNKDVPAKSLQWVPLCATS